MNIEAKKAELFKVLDEIRADINVLLKRLDEASLLIDAVETYVDAIKFDESFDIEDGLKHIRLF